MKGRLEIGRSATVPLRMSFEVSVRSETVAGHSHVALLPTTRWRPRTGSEAKKGRHCERAAAVGLDRRSQGEIVRVPTIPNFASSPIGLQNLYAPGANPSTTKALTECGGTTADASGVPSSSAAMLMP
jgi:hypothetical protein